MIRRLGLAAALAAAALPAAAGEARAAVYAVDTCANGSLSGWSHFNFGVWSTWGNSCGVAGGALGAGIATAAGSSAGWTFEAPPDTEIAAFAVSRAYVLPGNRPYGTGVYTLATRGPGQGYFDNQPNFGGALRAGPAVEAAGGLRGQTALSAQVDCGGGSECTGPAELSLYAAHVELRDEFAPTLSGLSGTLLAPGPLKGVRALSYAAADRGGGVARQALLVDGAVRSERAVDGCAGPPFALVVPCPLSVSGTVSLDTTQLAEGEHAVELTVADVTGVNVTRYGPFEIVVDNVPPPRSVVAPRITGTAAEGATLVADDGAWSPWPVALARRWQRSESGSWEDVAGATGPAYTLTAEDAGHRLRLRVRATSGEGSTDAYSEPSALVAAAPVPAPSATPDPAATPAPTAAPPASSPPAASPPPTAVVRVEIGGPASGFAPPAGAPRPAAPSADLAGATLTAAFTAGGRSALTVGWGERRRVRGRLARADGTGVAGARIDVASRVRALDGEPVPLARLTTDAAGRFGYTVGAGVSRAIEFSVAGRTATVTVRVIPRVSLRAVRSGRTVTLRGRVTGAPPGLRKVVELQVAHGRAWRALASTRLAPSGGSYALRRVTTGRRFRAVVRSESGWPFLTGASPPRGASGAGRPVRWAEAWPAGAAAR